MFILISFIALFHCGHICNNLCILLQNKNGQKSCFKYEKLNYEGTFVSSTLKVEEIKVCSEF